MTHTIRPRKVLYPSFADEVKNPYETYRCSTCFYREAVTPENRPTECEILTTVEFPACGAWKAQDLLGGYTIIGFVRIDGAIGVFKAVRFRLVALNRDNAQYLAREALAGMGYEIHHTLAFHPTDDVSVKDAVMALAAEDI